MLSLKSSILDSAGQEVDCSKSIDKQCPTSNRDDNPSRELDFFFLAMPEACRSPHTRDQTRAIAATQAAAMTMLDT